MPGQPIVSVCVVTFQHAAFIGQCLDSIIRQKTNFEIEILIGEDGSTDGTAEACDQFAARHPGKVTVFHRSRKDVIYINGKGTGRFNAAETLKAAKGKYIAFLEGDDYWCDPLKLQKQVDALEAHPECACCHHWQRSAVLLENGSYEERPAAREGQGYYNRQITTVEDIFANRQRIKSRTMMFRNFFLSGMELPQWFFQTQFGDVPLSMLIGKYGSFYFIDEEMAVYRITGKGVSTIGKENWLFTFHHYIAWVLIWEYGDKWYDGRFHRQAMRTIFYFYRMIFQKYSYDYAVFIKMLSYASGQSKLSFWSRSRVSVVLCMQFLGGRIKRFF